MSSGSAGLLCGVHGFGSGFGPAPTAGLSSRTPFQGGEAFRPAHRAPSPQPAEKKKLRIVGGRVVFTEDAVDETPTPQVPAQSRQPTTAVEACSAAITSVATQSTWQASVVSTAVAVNAEGRTRLTVVATPVSPGAAPNIPEHPGAAISARAAARAAAIARSAASTSSPISKLAKKRRLAAAKKRRLTAVHARSADALVKDSGADEVRSTGWARFATPSAETGGGSCADDIRGAAGEEPAASKTPSPLASETSIAPMLRAALRGIKLEHTDKHDAAFRALLTYVTNIIEHPHNPQFRRINKVRSSL